MDAKCALTAMRLAAAERDPYVECLHLA